MTTAAPTCVHCPRVPAQYIGCKAGRPICARHACIECKPIAQVDPGPEGRTGKLFGCRE